MTNDILLSINDLKTQIYETWNQRQLIEEKKRKNILIILFSLSFFIISFILAIFSYNEENLKTFKIILSISFFFVIFATVFFVEYARNILLLKKKVINIDISVDEYLNNKYNLLYNSYNLLQSSNKIFFVLDSCPILNAHSKLSAKEVVNRSEIKLKSSKYNFLKTSHKPIVFNNPDKDVLIIYPYFIILIKYDDIFILDWKELKASETSTVILEKDNIPGDANIIGATNKYINKDGSPDHRYRYNPGFYRVQYFELSLNTSFNFKITYQFSNFSAAENFYKQLKDYQSEII